jgi:hypothetical protein
LKNSISGINHLRSSVRARTPPGAGSVTPMGFVRTTTGKRAARSQKKQGFRA